jgi:hypothetical protein
VAVLLLRLFYGFIRSKGVSITGDEPSYVMQAQSYAHLSPQILPTIHHDLAANVFPTTYPANATASMVEQFKGPQGIVSPFEPGLGILLLPFVVVLGAVIAPVSGAVIGTICLNTAGLMWLHQRASRLFRLDAVGQVVLGVMFAGPALLLATNQIYPDLPAGILIAMGLLEIAAVEMEGVSVTSVVVVAAAVGGAPWLQPKNLGPAVILLVAFAIVAWRRAALIPLAWVVGIGLLSWLGFFAYNEHYYGHLLGLPEPPVRASKLGLEYTLGLLFDRDHGLFVQVPYCLIGIAGLVAYGWRRSPAAVLAVLGSFLSVLVLNGTYTHNPYGGLSLAGRFMWSLIPMSLPWIALVIVRWNELRRARWLPLVAVLGVWAYEAFPVIASQHVYYNPWGATGLWPGWWRGLTRVLPYFGRGRRFLGAPAYGLPLELVTATLVTAGLLLYLRGGPGRTLGRRRPGAARTALRAGS